VEAGVEAAAEVVEVEVAVAAIMAAVERSR
jgi:hypothetical protein